MIRDWSRGSQVWRVERDRTNPLPGGIAVQQAPGRAQQTARCQLTPSETTVCSTGALRSFRVDSTASHPCLMTNQASLPPFIRSPSPARCLPNGIKSADSTSVHGTRIPGASRSCASRFGSHVKCLTASSTHDAMPLGSQTGEEPGSSGSNRAHSVVMARRMSTRAARMVGTMAARTPNTPAPTA